ncbi:LamG-like jellyroll fold domain-containing protein [Metabacillus bambusae]|uniref:LamG-like jellyroll fold domain-containing protein n=1 Tax=Metabacillus bambusae TaxID=2795218 RepID=A0ABS3N7P4_9BACI|nr:LamG-like jellyroll fold domain-containing protein [Metabacillus bambusae]MBO1514014.1 hypothetical protein [Metabacillus bambusae]
MVWESDDLINWSDQRMIEIAPEDAGNAWAPETIYDPTTGEYVVYWASNVDGHNIYYAKTRDFWTFTKPEIYVPKTETNTFIDTSMIEHNGSYYRFTKNEQDISVFLEKSDSVLGDFELVKNKVGDQGGVEGPGIFKMNGIEKWILLLDGYAGSNSGAGFFPLIAESAEDLDKGNFRRLENTEFRMPTGAKHGSILPVTQKEYDAVMEKWGKALVKPVSPDTGEKIIPDLKYTFDEDLQGTTVKNTSASSVQNNGKLHNGASYKEDAEKGKVLYLGGGNAGTESPYLEFPQGYFDGKDNVSIFMDIKSEMDNQFFFTFGVGQNEQKYLFLRTRPNEIYSTLTVKSWSKEQKVIEQLSSPIKNTWTNIGIVLERNADGNHSTMKLYKDGVLVGEETQLVANLSTMGADLKAYLGKAFYNDPYFKGAFDNVRVYNRALTDDQVNHVFNQDPEEPGEEADETPPEGQFTINNGAEFTNKSTANLSLEAKDDISGVSQVRYSTNAKEWSEWEEFKPSIELTLPAGDGEKTVFVEFKDHAGNISESYQQKITLDTTAPVIEFTGYKETYSVDSSIKITCSIIDELSGIASKECENVEGPAYEFELRINKITATATDNAGNTAKAEIEFTVTVDFDSLGRLTEALVTKEGVAESLVKKLQSAKESAAKDNNQAMNGQLNAYENQLKAQSGKSISEENTKILINLLKQMKE